MAGAVVAIIGEDQEKRRRRRRDKGSIFLG